MRWLIFIIFMLTLGCARPQPQQPQQHKDKIAKEDRKKEEENKEIIAPPPAYGNKVVRLFD